MDWDKIEVILICLTPLFFFSAPLVLWLLEHWIKGILNPTSSNSQSRVFNNVVKKPTLEQSWEEFKSSSNSQQPPDDYEYDESDFPLEAAKWEGIARREERLEKQWRKEEEREEKERRRRDDDYD